MKLIIEPEKNDKFKRIEYANCTQVAVMGTFIREKIAPATFRQAIISDANELLGLVGAMEEDIRDFKHRAPTSK